MSLENPYSDAADLLLDQVAKLNSVLIKHKEKHGEDNQVFKDYTRMRDVMLYAINYINKNEVWYRKSIILHQENTWLKEAMGDIEKRLSAYEIVEDLILTNKFDATVARVKEYVARREAIINQRNDKP